MRPDQERVKNLLTDTVTLLCKNGLQFDKELKVQGLLGITTDDNDVFVVHINEKFGDLIGSVSVSVRSESGDKGFVDLTEKRTPQAIRSRKRPSQDSNYSSSSPAKVASPSGTPFSSRNVQSHRNPHHVRTPAKLETRIKTEDGVELSSCQEQQQGRLSNRDDRNAMQESYSDLSICDIQTGTLGARTLKRRSVPSASVSTPGQLSGDSGSDTNPGDPFATGLVRNQMQHGAIDSDLSGLGQLTADSLPGSGEWDPTQVQGNPLDPGDPQQDVRTYRSRHSAEKREHCTQCEKSFFHKKDLIRHQRTKHGKRSSLTANVFPRKQHKQYVVLSVASGNSPRPIKPRSKLSDDKQEHCPQCAKSFHHRKDMLRHFRTKHGEPS